MEKVGALNYVLEVVATFYKYRSRAWCEPEATGNQIAFDQISSVQACANVVLTNVKMNKGCSLEFWAGSKDSREILNIEFFCQIMKLHKVTCTSMNSRMVSK